MDLLDYLKGLPPFGWLSGVIIALFAMRYVYRGARFLYTTAVRTASFLDDWQGHPARPGVPVRLGVLERLSNVEGQLTTNGGTSLKDQTNRIEIRLNEHIAASSETRH